MKHVLTFLLIILQIGIIWGQSQKPDYKKWDAFLQKYVTSDGIVDYKSIKANIKEIKDITTQLSKIHVQTYWTANEQLAYWINIYNAYTIQLVVSNYPIKSIQKLDNGKTWDVKRYTIAKKKYSLNDIEHKIIRPQFKDYRIHFAINCAAKSCPPLLNQAYIPNTLEKQLEQQTFRFMNDQKFQIIHPKVSKISKILDWYATDFGNIVTFINKYSNVSISKATKIEFLEYDWSLNAK